MIAQFVIGATFLAGYLLGRASRPYRKLDGIVVTKPTALMDPQYIEDIERVTQEHVERVARGEVKHIHDGT